MGLGSQAIAASFLFEREGGHGVFDCLAPSDPQRVHWNGVEFNLLFLGMRLYWCILFGVFYTTPRNGPHLPDVYVASGIFFSCLFASGSLSREAVFLSLADSHEYRKLVLTSSKIQILLKLTFIASLRPQSVLGEGPLCMDFSF